MLTFIYYLHDDMQWGQKSTETMQIVKMTEMNTHMPLKGS